MTIPSNAIAENLRDSNFRAFQNISEISDLDVSSQRKLLYVKNGELVVVGKYSFGNRIRLWWNDYSRDKVKVLQAVHGIFTADYLRKLDDLGIVQSTLKRLETFHLRLTKQGSLQIIDPERRTPRILETEWKIQRFLAHSPKEKARQEHARREAEEVVRRAAERRSEETAARDAQLKADLQILQHRLGSLIDHPFERSPSPTSSLGSIDSAHSMHSNSSTSSSRSAGSSRRSSSPEPIEDSSDDEVAIQVEQPSMQVAEVVIRRNPVNEFYQVRENHFSDFPENRGVFIPQLEVNEDDIGIARGSDQMTIKIDDNSHFAADQGNKIHLGPRPESTGIFARLFSRK